MKSTLIHYIALASILLFSLQTVGQQYPVQANLSISSPCPNKLSSLFPLSGSRLNLAILLTDVSQPEVQARLSVKIEGAGLTIQSRPDFSMPVFTLQGGIPLALSHQLEHYFRVSSLTATGNGAMQFMQNGILPEGFFTITVTVVEHRRNVPISNTAQAFAWVVVNDPPQLITPTNNQTVEPGGMQNVFISWAPRHVVTPMAGSQITYNLSLWEVPQGFDPQMVVSSLQPLETVSTLSTNVVWGPDKSALTPGKRYVVAVKAVDSSNEVIFKNNGLSVAHSFVYGQPCHTPINLEHSNVYIQTADLAWYPLGAAQNFRVEFKPTSEPDDAWRDIEVTEPKISLANLAPNTKYDYRVSAVCGSFVSNPTANRTFTTHAMQPLEVDCSPDVTVPQFDQSPLLSNLTPGLVFMAAGFMVETVTFKEIAPYTFDGTGIITLPLYKFALRADLKGVQINHSLHLVGGTVEAQYGDELTFLGEQGDEDQGPGSVDFSNPNDTIVLSSPIDSVYMNDDGTWTVVDTDGDTTVITPGEGGTLVVDEVGNGVVIIGEEVYPVSDVFNDDPNGNGAGGGAGGGTGPSISPTSICNQKVNFSSGGSMHKYGFDTYKENLPSGTYSTIRAGEETLHLAWKSVATGGSDRLLVTPTTDSTLTFSYQGGMPLTGSSIADGYHVWSGSPPAGEDNLLALCSADSAGNASVAGGVRVKAYDLKRHKLSIVPVGNSQPSFTKAELQSALNSIYAQAVTEWEVTFEERLDADGLTVTPEVNETDYSNDMRAIWRAYVGQRTPVPGTTYLFIIQGFADNPDMVGYMPLRSGYGFLTPTATPRDAAHELGHGVFNLRHTFSDNNVVNLPEGSTKNLMDYSTGSELFKYQWDYIHNPEGGLFVFEDSEEGAMWDSHLSKESIRSIINLIRYDNIDMNETSDLSVFSFSKGSASNLKLTDDFVLDYIDIEVGSGKKNNLEDQPFTYEELYINPIEIKSEKIPDPTGQSEKFIKLYYNRMDQAAPPRTDLVKTSELGIFFAIKEAQRGPFERYIFGETLSDTINIYITRTQTGNNTTTGTLRTGDRSIYGYTVELPRGTESQCSTNCTDEETPYDCHCIVEGVYSFEINTNVYNAGNTKNHSLRIVSPVPNGRTGVLVHGGRDDAKGWSQGCILPMPNSPEINSVLFSPNRNNTVTQSIDFTKEILDWVRMREVDIMERNEDISNVVKQIIITKTF